jgi:putative colanic acid biosynthesis acetyltransferase WcaB
MTASMRDLFSLVRLEFGLAKGVRMSSVVVLFRLASYARHGKSGFRHLFHPVSVFYKIYTEFLLGIELPAGTKVGPGLRIYHGVGLVVHKGVRIGSYCILRQGVTIGNKGEGEQVNQLPIIGDNVDFGAGSIVLGHVHIGNSVIIGAGTVVTKDVPANATVVGAPSRILAPRS